MTAAPINVEQVPDPRPQVGRDAGNRPLWIGLGMIGLAGFGLFAVLDAGRRERLAPAVRATASELSLAPPSAPPSLYIPPSEYPEEPVVVRIVPSVPSIPPPPRLGPSPQARPMPPVAVLPPQPNYVPLPSVAPSPLPDPPSQADAPSAIIVDGGVAAIAAPSGATTAGETAAGGGGAAGSSVAVATRPPAVRNAERALVVSQGTLIGAVLETGLDSTQPGQARALVSSDVRARRSPRVLIPKGSRLFGTYQGDLAAGQNRVLVQWTRLVRPDGVSVAIDSPATDRLGRAGIKGQVNSHFLQRLGGALLQSAIDIGTIVAARSSYDSPVLIAVPGRLSGVASDLVGSPPKPTISVRPGTRISVFVVRDLDFSDVEARR